MRRSSAAKQPSSGFRKKPKKKHIQEVSSEYLKLVASLEEHVPKQSVRRYKERNEERARYRVAELRRGERLQNGDKWGNTWYRRHRFLENLVERSERDIRTKRMLLGWNYDGRYTQDSLADVTSVRWRSAAASTARFVGGLPNGDLHEVVPRWVGTETLTDATNVILVCRGCHTRIENGEFPGLKQSLPWQRYLPLDSSPKQE